MSARVVGIAQTGRVLQLHPRPENDGGAGKRALVEPGDVVGGGGSWVHIAAIGDVGGCRTLVGLPDDHLGRREVPIPYRQKVLQIAVVEFRYLLNVRVDSGRCFASFVVRIYDVRVHVAVNDRWLRVVDG